MEDDLIDNHSKKKRDFKGLTIFVSRDEIVEMWKGSSASSKDTNKEDSLYQSSHHRNPKSKIDNLKDFIGPYINVVICDSAWLYVSLEVNGIHHFSILDP